MTILSQTLAVAPRGMPECREETGLVSGEFESCLRLPS